MDKLYFVVAQSILDAADNLVDGVYNMFSQINVGDCKMCKTEEEAMEFAKKILQIESINEDDIEIATKDDGTIHMPFINEIRGVLGENETVIIFIGSFEELD